MATSKGGNATTKDDGTNVTVRLSGDVIASLDAEAEARMVSRARLVEFCVREGLALLPPIPGRTVPEPVVAQLEADAAEG